MRALARISPYPCHWKRTSSTAGQVLWLLYKRPIRYCRFAVVYVAMANRNREVFILWSDIQDIVGPSTRWPHRIRRLFWPKNIVPAFREIVCRCACIRGRIKSSPISGMGGSDGLASWCVCPQTFRKPIQILWRGPLWTLSLRIECDNGPGTMIQMERRGTTRTEVDATSKVSRQLFENHN